MRTTIYLVRHAEAETNVNPLFSGEVNGLTEIGLQQSKNLASYFKNIRIVQIFTSDILRAKLTANEIATGLNKEVVVLGNTVERKIHYSSPTDYKPTETFEDFDVRLRKTKQFFENLPEGRYIFVGHAIFIKALVSYLMLGDQISEKLCESISDTLVIDNGTVSKCIYNTEKQKWRIASLNEKVLIG